MTGCDHLAWPMAIVTSFTHFDVIPFKQQQQDQQKLVLLQKRTNIGTHNGFRKYASVYTLNNSTSRIAFLRT